jgi:riboflavin synthase alpha subunit
MAILHLAIRVAGHIIVGSIAHLGNILKVACAERLAKGD